MAAGCLSEARALVLSSCSGACRPEADSHGRKPSHSSQRRAQEAECLPYFPTRLSVSRGECHAAKRPSGAEPARERPNSKIQGSVPHTQSLSCLDCQLGGIETRDRSWCARAAPLTRKWGGALVSSQQTCEESSKSSFTMSGNRESWSPGGPPLTPPNKIWSAVVPLSAATLRRMLPWCCRQV